MPVAVLKWKCSRHFQGGHCMRTQTKTSVMKLAAVGAVAGLVSGLVKL
ncbi:MAG: DUF1440 domain-containing protein, partial [Lacticaseibacillus paracasei]|nr:DUF1440 domain-containing protein [Lacticaseibacillus paracasei]